MAHFSLTDHHTIPSPSRNPAMESNKSPQVDLLPAEQLLRELLLDCRDSLQTQSTPTTTHEDGGKETPKLEMWFVGGWLRDKLLGQRSADIDVALSSATTITPSAFARHLEHFFLAANNNGDKYKTEAAKRGIESAEIRGFYHIERNPGKGKHLETTSAQIFGLEVDFVNLRRDPEAGLKFSSLAAEDAFRRDANVNAIFYNVDTQEIEDHTKKGLADIQARVLRTPLDPRITFTDDPLRILRLIRLASTLVAGFTIGHETQLAMKDPELQALLRTKISPERIGGELKKMMLGPRPVVAFRWIYEMGLYGSVFLDGLDVTMAAGEEDHWPATWLRACVALAEMDENSGVAKEIVQTEDRESVWLMAAWSPLAQLRGKDNDGAIVKAATKAINAASKKWKVLGEAFKNTNDIRLTVDEVNKHNNDSPLPRSELGVAIRTWGVSWKLQVLYSLLSELTATEATKEQQTILVNRYSTFLRAVSLHNLSDAPTLKPMLNGGDIKAMFGLKKSGAFMKDVFDAVLRWQFDHAGATREEAETWLRGEKGRLNIPDGAL
jgi:tRNA nucleotidyltransferase (CCA-adding enzyme)